MVTRQKKLGPRPLLRELEGIKGLIILIYSKNIKCIFFTRFILLIRKWKNDIEM